MTLLDTHRALLDGALAASAARAYWSPFPENASPKIYGETAQTDGQAGDHLAHQAIAIARSVRPIVGRRRHGPSLERIGLLVEAFDRLFARFHRWGHGLCAQRPGKDAVAGLNSARNL